MEGTKGGAVRPYSGRRSTPIVVQWAPSKGARKELIVLEPSLYGIE